MVAEINHTNLDQEEMIELNDDLWKTIQEVSHKVNEAMQRDRMRNELKKYLHHEDVKEMCRFATDIGIRGDMLREFRFKWAREKLEEVEFYRNLGKMKEKAEEDSEEKVIKVESLPERRGKFEYKIYGLDLSGENWKEVAEKVEEVESKYVKGEAKEVVGRSKRLEDKFFGLDWEKDNFMTVLNEWAESLEARRVDWLALLERIKERSLDMYFKVAELLLTEESFRSNIRDYSKLIEEHLKVNHLEDAQRIFKKMTEAGIEPDLLTHNILIHMYCKAGDLDQAETSFNIIKKADFKLNIKGYTSMIKAYAKAGVPQRGVALTNEMERNKLKPTEEIYIELLKAYAEKGEVDGAQRIINVMLFHGMKQTLESVSLLVEAYAKAKEPEQAREAFNQMTKYGLKPDDRCTATMMKAYAMRNMLDKALDLLLTLKKDGFKPGVCTNSVFVDWLGSLQLVHEAEQLVEEIKAEGDIPLDVHVSLCVMYLKGGLEGKARESLKVLEGRKNELRGDQFERVASMLLESGFSEEAKGMYDAMEGLGFKPSQYLAMKYGAAQSYSKHRPVSTK